MRILYAVGSWGLGHATRNVPVLEALRAGGHDLTIISSGRALLLLRRELGSSCEFLDWPHVPQTLGHSAWGFYVRSAAAILAFVQTMQRERAQTQALLRRRRFDRIVSDNRYGVQHPDVPSFHITNSVRFIAPGRIAAIEWLLEAFNYRWFRTLRRVIVPDTEDDALAGDLAHRLRIFPARLLAYVGILSHIRARPAAQDLDAFISISGPEPQRTLLERLVRAQVPSVRGRVAVALGRPEAAGVERSNGVEIHSFLERAAQEEMMNRARVIVARPGFSTISALAELGRKGAVIPTPGQTEQVYLAAYHHARGALHSVPQQRLRLDEDIAAAAHCRGLDARIKTADAVRRVVQLISAG